MYTVFQCKNMFLILKLDVFMGLNLFSQFIFVTNGYFLTVLRIKYIIG